MAKTAAKAAPKAAPKTKAKPKRLPVVEDVRIDYVALETLRRWPRNPKLHDLDRLGDSIERFGFVQPILVDERTGQIVAGHGRLEALQKMQGEGRAPPNRIKVEDGTWLVPVLRGVGFENEQEAEAYLLADNRLVETGGWDEKLLLESFKALDPELVEIAGWDERAVNKMLAKAAKETEAAPPPEEENVYLAAGVRQVVFHMSEADYDRVIKVLESLQEQWNLKTNAAVFVRMCKEHEA